MKNLFLLLIISTFCISCNTATDKNASSKSGTSKVETFGESITDGGVSMSEALSQLASANGAIEKIKVKGKINAVCQVKGCWMNMDAGDGKEVRVKFKDYAFFVPKDAGGKETVIEGRLFNDTTSVDMLKHYAEDEGKTQAEIDQITTPEIEPAFEATGVIIM